MNTEYRYQLETPRVTGRRQQKTQCPECGRRRCFVRYVDTHDQFRYLSDSVGKCDHQHSCGYHYRPSEYFRDRPWLRDTPHRVGEPPVRKPLYLPPLPASYVALHHRHRSTFWLWMSTTCKRRLQLSDGDLQRVFDDYLLGATRQQDVIFWQIDEHQQVRTGHIMQYGPDGHRLGYQNWYHARLQQIMINSPLTASRYPAQLTARQCLFGLHLLARYPDKTVCLVESEKTAVLMAVCQPQHLWMATSGSGGLSAEKLEPLRGRRLAVFPDSGCYAKWRQKLQEAALDFSISDALECYEPNTDLADVLLGEARRPP